MRRLLVPAALASCAVLASCGGTTRSLVGGTDCDAYAQGVASQPAESWAYLARYQLAYRSCMGWN